MIFQRTGLVDEVALIEALKNKRIAGAGLDVFTQEPLPIDSPLLKLNNVGELIEIILREQNPPQKNVFYNN